MQNRLTECFTKTPTKKLTVYFTAGYPQLNSTLPLCQMLEQAGADIIEIGIPFSDPLADGPVIQACSEKALNNGMNLHLLFEQLAELRAYVSIPVLLMGYLNPVLQFGLRSFCQACKKVGIDGAIIPDLPLTQYRNEAQRLFEEFELSNIFLITPTTPPQRIRLYDQHTNGFIYAVSSPGVTGNSVGAKEALTSYLERINALNLGNPIMVGFGVSSKADFDMITVRSAGAIVGTAFLREINKNGATPSVVTNFIKMIRG